MIVRLQLHKCTTRYRVHRVCSQHIKVCVLDPSQSTPPTSINQINTATFPAASKANQRLPYVRAHQQNQKPWVVHAIVQSNATAQGALHSPDSSGQRGTTVTQPRLSLCEGTTTSWSGSNPEQSLWLLSPAMRFVSNTDGDGGRAAIPKCRANSVTSTSEHE